MWCKVIKNKGNSTQHVPKMTINAQVCITNYQRRHTLLSHDSIKDNSISRVSHTSLSNTRIFFFLHYKKVSKAYK